MNKRIWQWLYDKRGGYTNGEIATALQIANNSVASVLFDMETRGMVRTGTTPRTAKTRRGPKPNEWFAVGTTFELLPVKPEFKVPTAAQMRRERSRVQKVAETTQGPTPEVTAPAPAVNIEDGLSLGEARALYQRLHSIFGGGK
jgi:hypothetical protein